MTEGQASEPPQGTPGRRALGAMESAVRRARESAGGSVAPADMSSDAAPEATPVVDREARGHTQSPTRERWLQGAVIAAAVLVLVAAAALAASLTGNGSPAPGPPAIAGPAHATRPATSGPARSGNTTGGNAATSSTSTTSGSTSTAPSVTPTPGGAPVISALVPASGSAGQGIQVAGANFLSSSGQITATFNGQVAPTTCPAQSTCTVTVPPLPGAGSAQVVITTSAGPSNPVTFTYS